MPRVTPSYSHRFKLDLGALEQIAKGVPKEILTVMGEGIAFKMGRRIRDDSHTVFGETLDPNSPGWHEFKLEDGFVGRPLVMTGAMTEKNAWKVKINQKSGTITLTLDSQHHKKWDTIINIAEKTGRNWDEAWGIGEEEFKHVMATLKRWLDKLLGMK